MHKVHKLFGVVVGIETMSHSFFHMLRWGLNGDIFLLWKTNTGITGLIALIITPLVCWPMYVPALKQKIKFEVRKGLHYLAIVWAMALLWHAPSRIYYLIGIPALIYAIDYFVGIFIRNTLIETVYFERYCQTGFVSFQLDKVSSFIFIAPLTKYVCYFYFPSSKTGPSIQESKEVGRDAKNILCVHHVSMDIGISVARLYNFSRLQPGRSYHVMYRS